MITLAADCLLFEMASGERIPYSADMVSVELVGDTAGVFDSEFVRHATKAVFHYFKHELGRRKCPVGEFAGALEKVLRGFAATAQLSAPARLRSRACWSTICAGWPVNPARAASWSSSRACAPNCSGICSRLRALLRFRGLRGCVKQLAGARRWSRRCRDAGAGNRGLPARMPERRIRPGGFLLLVE